MHRRNMLKAFGGAGAGLLAAPGPLAQAQETARRGLPPLKITDIKTILTQPAGDHLVIVKVLTSEPGLYGVGCATHRERPLAVAAYVDKYLKPFLVGKNCDEIEDIWQSAYVASYFRAGVTGNNALSGVDGALWDILGKRCGVPVYKLLGGKVRAAVPLYTHAAARSCRSSRTRFAKFRAEGYRHIRVQLAVPGFSGYGVGRPDLGGGPEGAARAASRLRPSSSPRRTSTTRSRCSITCASKIGFDVELLHDVHERVPPNQAIQLCKAVEPYRLFFLEDPFAPEDVAWFRTLRQQTSCAARDGRAVRQPQRVGAPGGRTADRLHPHAHLRGRRPEHGPQGGGVLRVLQCPHGLARSRQRFAGGPRGQHAPRPGQLQLRHPGAEPASPPLCARSFPARRRSRAAICTPTTSRDWASTSMRGWRRSSHTKAPAGAAATTGGWTGRSCGHSEAHPGSGTDEA